MAVNVVVATVQALTGTVIARDAEGNSRVLAVGDPVYAGEEVIPLKGATVQLEGMDGGSLSLGEGQQALVGEALAESGRADNPDIPTAEEVIEALERGESLDALIAPPAAGLEGGDSEGGGFVRVARISEPVEPINYTFPVNVFDRPDAMGETVAVPGGETADTAVPPGPPPVEPPPPVTANPTLTVSVSLAAGYGYEDASEAQAGDVIFDVSHVLDLDGLDPALASAITYSIVGGDTTYLVLEQDGSGNWVVVLTEEGAEAVRSGTVEGNQLSVTVEGTVVLTGMEDLVATDGAFAPVPELIVEPPPDADPSLTVTVVVAADYGYEEASQAAAGDVVFDVSHALDLDGLDPALASAITYSIVGGDTSYLALEQDGFGNWVVVLTEEGAEAVRNGTVEGNQLSVTVEGTVVLTGMDDLVASDGAFAPVPELIVEPPPEPDLYAWAHTVGIGSEQGTMANANNLKETDSNSAVVSYRDGFFAVDHQGNNEPDAIDPREALLFGFAEPTSSALFQIEGTLGGGTYILYGEDGAPLGESRSLADDVNAEGFLEITGEPFSYVAFLGGRVGTGQDRVDSEFSVKPVGLSVQVGEDEDAEFYPATGGEEGLATAGIGEMAEADDYGANFLTVDTDQDIFVISEGGQGTTDDPARFVIQGFSLDTDASGAKITLG
uniref:retention module-containing protein n=1 Tax=Thioalkalivibrio thiocyanoxidans TaxID=152475 RepID=UPI0012EAE715